MRISNKFVFIGIAVLLVFVALYQFVKSSTPLDIGIKTIQEISIQGNYFEGDWKDERIKNYHLIADSLANQDGSISTAIYYNDPNEEDGFLKAFVGIESNQKQLNPVFSEIRKIETGEYIFGRINNDFYQIPQRIYMEMEEFAKDNGHEIGEFSVEQYFSDTLMLVFIPIFSK